MLTGTDVFADDPDGLSHVVFDRFFGDIEFRGNFLILHSMQLAHQKDVSALGRQHAKDALEHFVLFECFVFFSIG